MVQTRLSHVPENYTLPECTNTPGYEGTFCMEYKKELFQWIENYAWNKVFWKGEENN